MLALASSRLLLQPASRRLAASRHVHVRPRRDRRRAVASLASLAGLGVFGATAAFCASSSAAARKTDPDPRRDEFSDDFDDEYDYAQDRGFDGPEKNLPRASRAGPLPIYQHTSLKLFAGSAHPQLAEEVASELGQPLSPCRVTRFANGETSVQLGTNVRDCDVFLLQPTCGDADQEGATLSDHLIEILLMADAARRSGAARITAVVPFFGYARMDCNRNDFVISARNGDNQPLARLCIQLMANAGVNRIVTVDVRSQQMAGFANTLQINDLYGLPLLSNYLRGRGIEGDDVVVVSPNDNEVLTRRADVLRKKLGASLAIVLPPDLDNRIGPKTKHNIIGEVKGKRWCVITSDVVDTANVVTRASDIVRQEGCERIVAAVVHGVLSSPAALKRVAESPMEELVVLDTTPLERKVAECQKLTVLSSKSVLAYAIQVIHNGGSLSEAFNYNSKWNKAKKIDYFEAGAKE